MEMEDLRAANLPRILGDEVTATLIEGGPWPRWAVERRGVS